MDRETSARDLSSQLHIAENTLDRAMIEIAKLAAALPDGRLRASVAAATAQPAFDGVAASLTALTEARAHLGGAHRTLSALARKLGLESVAAGPMDKPEDRPPLDGSEPLRANVVNEA